MLSGSSTHPTYLLIGRPSVYVQSKSYALPRALAETLHMVQKPGPSTSPLLHAEHGLDLFEPHTGDAPFKIAVGRYGSTGSPHSSFGRSRVAKFCTEPSVRTTALLYGCTSANVQVKLPRNKYVHVHQLPNYYYLHCLRLMNDYGDGCAARIVTRLQRKRGRRWGCPGTPCEPRCALGCGIAPADRRTGTDLCGE